MMTNTNTKILSCEIEQDGKKYKLINFGDSCKGCAFNSVVDCPCLNDEFLCTLDGRNNIWKEMKNE